MSLIPRPPKELSEDAIWQDVEFGSYAQDLPLYEELAAAADGPVLELGAGSGRVAVHLARLGHRVIAVDSEPTLTAELHRRAEGLPLEVLTADAARLGDAWGERPRADIGLVIAPLQVLQLFAVADRRGAMEALVPLLAPGGRVAVALVDEGTLANEGVAAQVKPDMREVEGWVFSSEPLWVQVSDYTLRMRRLRERVSPAGDLVRKVHDDILNRVGPGELEAEAESAGLRAAERREIPSSAYEAGSVLVILEKP